MPLKFACPASDCDEVRDVKPDMIHHVEEAHPGISRDEVHGKFVAHGKTSVYLARCHACGTLQESTEPLPELCASCREGKASA